jgi:hypothetical protein
MSSPMGERATGDALRYGTALLKFISPNDVDLNGAHQYGYYLPKVVYPIFTPHPPERGRNDDHSVLVTWPDGRVTESVVKWYGTGTRREYRLTRFGKDFPYRTADNLGDLLVLIPTSPTEINAYVLYEDDDIEELQATLGVEVLPPIPGERQSWALYQRDVEVDEDEDAEDACLNRHFKAFTEAVNEFPAVKVFSEATRVAIFDCVEGFGSLSTDEQLLRLVREEYNLFRMVERKIFLPEVQRLFGSIDDFLDTAHRITNARKSRAGRAFENHVEYVLSEAGIPFEMRRVVDKTRPDIIIPGKAEYDDPRYPTERLVMIGVKTTCKDRWRQVTKEAPRVEEKHILTIQEGISGKQLDEMEESNVRLIVPAELHRLYPRNHPIMLFDVDGFIESVRTRLAQ